MIEYQMEKKGKSAVVKENEKTIRLPPINQNARPGDEMKAIVDEIGRQIADTPTLQIEEEEKKEDRTTLHGQDASKPEGDIVETHGIVYKRKEKKK